MVEDKITNLYFISNNAVRMLYAEKFYINKI